MAKRRYKIVRTSVLDDLWDEVNDAISEGWEPLGGVTQVVGRRGRLDDQLKKWYYSFPREDEWMQTLWLPPEKKTSWWRK